MGASNAKVGIFDPETEEEAVVDNGALHVIVDSGGGTTGGATEATLAKLMSPAGQADANNPVKVGGVFNTTPPTYTNGQRSNFSTDARGALRVILSPGVNNQPFLSDNEDTKEVTASVATPVTVNRNTMFNGTTWDRMRGDVANGLDVDVTHSVIPGISIPAFDYFSHTWTAGTFTDVYVYKTGGAGGTTVATVTTIYTDATRSNIVTCTRT